LQKTHSNNTVNAPQQSSILLIDLSGDARAAADWAAARFGQAQVDVINKADLKWASRREALARARALKPSSVALFTADLNTQSQLAALMIFGALTGARCVVIGDKNGDVITRTRLSIALLEAPRLVFELAVGYLLVIPISWLFTEALGAALLFRPVILASRNRYRRSRESMSALYLRATLGSSGEGGMRTHVAGFARGAVALGHRLRFIESGLRPRDDLSLAIMPSRTLSATRALFELWNNLIFTAKCLELRATFAADIDFIYQRYSRFNWTGVMLSIATGLPLALEFNGSEVWLSRHWDPIGQVWLLKRFERLNLRAADIIFVVAEVEKRNLIATKIAAEKIFVNANGVDADRFRPHCGGNDIRRSLGIDNRIVVGFAGTFGPWHGAPVLAEAARLVTPNTNCQFVFVGDGDQRAQTESIIDASRASATFTGRISHDAVPAYLDACDILVSPHVSPADGSEFFGSPTKLFEYLSMAKAVIASRLGQIADVIDDDDNGMLVEPGDARALADAIERLARDESLRERLGVAARQTVVERYTWRHNAARVFDAMISGDSGSHN
jgi:glycosyltransferase involved in cell wall biosynthesis